MFDIPPDSYAPVEAPAYVIEYCTNYASQRFGVHPLVIRSIIEVEGGKMGTVSKNSNGTYDLGIMQINTIHLKDIESNFPGIDATLLINSPCANIAVGTWILSSRIKEAPDLWTGVGNYHSRTPKYHNRYLKKVDRIYRRLLNRFYRNT